MHNLRKAPFLIGLGLFLVLAAGFVGVAIFGLANNGRNEFDDACAKYWQQFGGEHPALTYCAAKFTYAGSVFILGPLCLAGLIWLLWSGNRWLAVVCLSIVLGEVGLNEAFKDYLQRSRPKMVDPDLVEPIVTERLGDFSFPSHHSMGSTVIFGVVGYVLAMKSQRRSGWFFLFALGGLVLLTAAICFSRVFLRAHWATDVLGGALLGAAWLALTIGVAEAWRIPPKLPSLPQP